MEKALANLNNENLLNILKPSTNLHKTYLERLHCVQWGNYSDTMEDLIKPKENNFGEIPKKPCFIELVYEEAISKNLIIYSSIMGILDPFITDKMVKLYLDIQTRFLLGDNCIVFFDNIGHFSKKEIYLLIKQKLIEK